MITIWSEWSRFDQVDHNLINWAQFNQVDHNLINWSQFDQLITVWSEWSQFDQKWSRLDHNLIMMIYKPQKILNTKVNLSFKKSLKINQKKILQKNFRFLHTWKVDVS